MRDGGEGVRCHCRSDAKGTVMELLVQARLWLVQIGAGYAFMTCCGVQQCMCFEVGLAHQQELQALKDEALAESASLQAALYAAAAQAASILPACSWRL